MLRISTFRILWKPAFQDALFLLENFLYRPERGKGKDAADSRDENAFNQQGSDSSRYSQNKKDPPAFRAPIIFRFHHNRMKKPDNQKGGGLASGFSSSNQIMGVRKTTDFLEKATWTLAGTVVVLSIVITAFIPRAQHANQSEIKEQINNAVTIDPNTVAFSRKSVVLRTPIIWLEEENPEARPPPFEF